MLFLFTNPKFIKYITCLILQFNYTSFFLSKRLLAALTAQNIKTLINDFNNTTSTFIHQALTNKSQSLQICKWNSRTQMIDNNIGIALLQDANYRMHHITTTFTSPLRYHHYTQSEWCSTQTGEASADLLNILKISNNSPGNS